MPNPRGIAFYLADEPSADSISRLTTRLNNDLVVGSMSPKAAAHRSRVVRQQTARLAQRDDSGPLGLVQGPVRPLITGLATELPRSEQAFAAIGALAPQSAERSSSADRWENEGGNMIGRVGRSQLPHSLATGSVQSRDPTRASTTPAEEKSFIGW